MKKRRRRHYDPEGEGSPLRRIGESMGELSRSLGMSEPATAAAVFGDWEALVGEGIAGHTRPRAVRDGVLTVAVESPAWATQMRHLEREVLAKMAARGARGVEGLRVVVDPSVGRGR